jgi:2,4-dienoyl-CoA reductase-like NADH-dependent reductase (Old Yellow Enzyme family)
LIYRSQFLSPKNNKRTDVYGGSLENRSRIIIQIFNEIKRRVPASFLLAIKLNHYDFVKGGFPSLDAAEMILALEEAGVDLIELSDAGHADRLEGDLISEAADMIR